MTMWRQIGTFSAGVAVLVFVACAQTWAEKAPAQTQVAQTQATRPATPTARESVNSLGMKMVLIPAGEFSMGSKFTPAEVAAKYGGREELYRDEHPRHKVRITRPFYIAAHEVTVGQFRQFVDDTAHKTDAEREGWSVGLVDKQGRLGKVQGLTWRSPGFAQGDDHPVVCVSWNDATAFCEWLTKKEGRTYQLPTEGQWEYACRAGTDTEYWWGDQMDTTGKVANVRDTGNWPVPSAPFNKMPMNDGYKFTAPVGSYRPNAWDLHDMIGNAMEWCADWYGPYSSGNQTDPTGAASGEGRVLRGGSGLYLANGCRSAIRDSDAPDGRYNNHGFRVVSGTE